MFFLGFLVNTSILFSQDLHFSQFNETPSLVNPALTGSAYVLRAAIIYKDQWNSVTVPYRTFGASVDMKLKASSWDKVDPYRSKSFKKSFSRLAAGLSFFSDKAGDGNMGTNQVSFSLASFIKTGYYSSISVGLQASMVQKSVDPSKFVFSNQYNGTLYDPNTASNEYFGTKNFIYPDFAAGASWNYGKEESVFGANDQIKGNAGVAVFHVNRPKQDFLVGSNEKLYSKIIVHANYLIGIPQSNIGVSPGFLFQFQGPQKDMIEGLMVKYYLKANSKYTGYIRKSSIGLGVYYRNKDAIILSTLLEIGQYAVGFSYDLNASGLTAASALRGGPEITIRFNSADPFLFQKR